MDRKLVANSSGSDQNPTPFLSVSPLTFSRARPAALLWSSWSKRRGRREGQYNAEMSMRSALNIFKHLTTSNYESRQSNCINWCKLYLMSNTKNNPNILFTYIYIYLQHIQHLQLIHKVTSAAHFPSWTKTAQSLAASVSSSLDSPHFGNLQTTWWDIRDESNIWITLMRLPVNPNSEIF